jgi:hypothetical protein
MLYLFHGLSYIVSILGRQLKSVSFLHNSEFRTVLKFPMTDFHENRSVILKVIADVYVDMIIKSVFQYKRKNELSVVMELSLK